MNNRNGFTLLEVIIAITIGSFVMLVTVGVMGSVSTGRTLVQENTEVADELRIAIDMMKKDIANVYRDADLKMVKFVCAGEGLDDESFKSLTMRCVLDGKVRYNQPESDIYEVQYFLLSDENGRNSLIRRVCPIVGIETEDESAGGVIMTIAENVVALDFKFFDGTEWLDAWDGTGVPLPDLVDVSLVVIKAAKADQEIGSGQNEEMIYQNKIMTRSFIASFPRFTQEGKSRSED